MKKLLLSLFIPLSSFAQQDSVLSGVYNWKEPAANNPNKISTVVLMEGKVHDFEWMQLNAARLMASSKKINYTVPENQEQLIIIKTGTLFLVLHDTSFAMNAGSIAVLMPGEKIVFNSQQDCSFYIMKYRRSNEMKRTKTTISSFVKRWDDQLFKPNNNGGGRRDYFEQATVLQKRFEMHVTTLKEGLRSHAPHIHRAEEIVLMIDGDTEMQVGENFYKGKTGDFFYLGSNVLHAATNVGSKPCTYFAIQFE